MTQADVKKHKKGGEVKAGSSVTGKNSKDNTPEDKGQQTPFAGGGSDLPSKKSELGPTLDRQPERGARRVQDRMQKILGTENSNSQMPQGIPDMPKRGIQNEQSIPESLSEGDSQQGTEKGQENKLHVSSSETDASKSKNEETTTKNAEISSSQPHKESSESPHNHPGSHHVVENSDGQKVDMTSASVSDRQNFLDYESPTYQKNEQMPSRTFVKTENNDPTHSATMHETTEVVEDSDDPSSQNFAIEQGDKNQQARQPKFQIRSPKNKVNLLMLNASSSLRKGGNPTIHQAAEVDEDSVSSETLNQSKQGKMQSTYQKKNRHDADTDDIDGDVDDLFDNGSNDHAENEELDQEYSPPNDDELNDAAQQAEDDMEMEFQELEKAQKKNLSQSNNLEFMKELAQKKRHQISASIHLADAFWSLKGKGLDGVKDSLNYAQSIDKLHRQSRESHENPDVMMSVLLYEPTTHDIRFDIKALKQISELPRIEPAIGFGPNMSEKLEPEKVTRHINQIIEQIIHPIAIGLIGLDKHYSPYTIHAQKALFETQLQIAVERNMPVYLTARKAEEFLAESLDKVLTKNHPPLIMTDLISSQELFDLVNTYDMHICLRPELTHEINKQALAFTKEVNPTRWMLCNGYSHSAPKGRELGLNKPEYLPETATQIGDLLKRTDDDLRTLCTGNMARLFFSSPWHSEKGQKEDIWSDFR